MNDDRSKALFQPIKCFISSIFVEPTCEFIALIGFKNVYMEGYRRVNQSRSPLWLAACLKMASYDTSTVKKMCFALWFHTFPICFGTVLNIDQHFVLIINAMCVRYSAKSGLCRAENTLSSQCLQRSSDITK